MADPLSGDRDAALRSKSSSSSFDSDPDEDALSIAPSVYSYRSSRDGQFMRQNVHGRLINGQTDLYALPADEEEYERLNTQHLMLRAALHDSLYPAKDEVRALLAPEENTKKAIMDVGTGAGVWATEMAEEFPHAEMVGVDLVLPTRDAPINCRFEADDVSLGMSHYHGYFDVVHVRSIAHGIPDFDVFIDDIADTVRPGGKLIVIDGTLQLFRKDKSRMDASESMFQKVLFTAYNALKARGCSGVDTGLMLQKVMKKNPKLKNHGYFEAFIPIGQWYHGDGTHSERSRWHYMGELLRRDCKGFAKALRPLLLTEGYYEDSVDHMIELANKELDQDMVNGWALWIYTWAERETYDIAPLNPKPMPIDEELLAAKLASVAVNEEKDDDARDIEVSELLPSKGESTNVVKLWLDDQLSDGGLDSVSEIASVGSVY